jgi:2-polyprenyl-6-methoxyphenol hydroxylase-like FAD-dependent oxidoreductase
MTSVSETDVVIVGSGIAGGALATALAASGIRVLVLERQVEYRDQVRGEILWPWGVRAARLVGVEGVLLEAGALVVPRLHYYDEGASSPVTIDVSESVSGIEGSLNITHPRACSALANAASAAGADVRTGIRTVRIEFGERPHVRWSDSDGVPAEAYCGLVVGADGRRSAVRSQARITHEVDPPAHLVAGLLVESVQGMAEVNVVGREADLMFYSFPQQGGRSRLYFTFPNGQEARFAGVDAPRRFLDTCTLDCLDGVAEWSSARPAGPCATFRGEDSRVLSPLAEGAVLIGDAAGYENPLQGQGLSMAMSDVHDVSQALLSTDVSGGLEEYAERRSTRKRLADVGTMLEVWLNEGFIVQNPEERAAREEFIDGDEVLLALAYCFRKGFDEVPQDLTRADLADRLAAYG